MNRRAARAALAAVAALLVLAATLPPSGEAPGNPSLFGDRASADFLANVILFLPLGLALAGLGWPARRVWRTAALLSLAVETAQLWIPGRHPSPVDVACNTAGALLGWFIGSRADLWLHPGGRLRRVLAAGALAAAALVMAGSLFLLRFDPQQTTYYGQWTPTLGSFLRYRGRVLETSLGNQPLEEGRMARSDDTRSRLLAGQPLKLRVIVGPEPQGLADVYSIYDHLEHEVLLVGADRTSLVLRYRMIGSALAFDVPDVRVAGAFRPFAPGDTVTLSLEGGPDNRCVQVAQARTCGVGFTVASGWGLLWYPDQMPAPLRALVGWLWVGGIGLLAGFWPRGAAAAGSLLVVCALCALLPPVLRQPTTPLVAWLALLAGFGAGQLAGIRVARLPVPAPQGSGRSARTTA